MRMIGKTTTAAVALAFAIALAACSNSTPSQYAGSWKVKDTSGADFEIVLASDGKATADRKGEGLSGTWKEEGGAAVIKWDSGWTTKISKEGDAYKKTAYEKDASAAPSNSSDAVKVK
jgi:hypothetical protein